MAPTSFAGRRRSFRSSSFFRSVLLGLAIFILIATWCSSATYQSAYAIRHTSFEPMTRQKQPFNQEVLPVAPNTEMRVSPQRSVLPLRVVSWNIRYATETTDPGEEPWRIRCPKLCAELAFIIAGQENPFVCLQEALYSQVVDIQAHLGSSWDYVGGGRDDGKMAGEFSPVFYRSDVWKCTKKEIRWLSPTPDRPSKGWDADLPRVVSIGEFEHRRTGTLVVVMSTHFDHLGAEAREKSARLLLEFIQEWGNETPSGRPSVVLLGGDFNSSPSEPAYKIMASPGSGVSDISDLIPVAKQHGNYLTYTGFGKRDERPNRIDFLFIQEPKTADIKAFGVLPNSFDDQVRSSDHRAVVADMDILV